MSAGRLDEALQYVKSGDYGVALSACRDVIERYPDDADALHLAGYLHQVKGEHEDALRYFAQAGLLAPDNAEIHNNHAGSLKALGRFEQAERYYRRAIALEDTARFEAIPGIGRKTAQRVVLELKEKLGTTADAVHGDAELADRPTVRRHLELGIATDVPHDDDLAE